MAEYPQKKQPKPVHTPSKHIGDWAEAQALAHLQAAGLVLLARNVNSPGRGGGEVDLIMREPDGTVVFVEVRHRHRNSHGGAAASVVAVKQRRIVFAARHYLSRWPEPPPCRFDVVALQDDADPPLAWLRGAFEAGSWD